MAINCSLGDVDSDQFHHNSYIHEVHLDQRSPRVTGSEELVQYTFIFLFSFIFAQAGKNVEVT